ncbi:MAG: accessory factor UbiK family protein [Gammaproteobacteria bacterium]|nr:accessory factor UbiK family protein [Gammaproteobacteria bacterium]MCY4219070.1 accessory factor UbiK family protein [Gammaproteobacteria bacterium]MCY4276006.1 accessory factor UbiK family protein [Gammaproteobacteria bacterium]
MPIQDRIKTIARNIEESLPIGLAKDFKSNIEAIVRSNLEGLDLVTSEQLTVQKKIVERAVKRIGELEERITELEAAARAEGSINQSGHSPERN